MIDKYDINYVQHLCKQLVNSMQDTLDEFNDKNNSEYMYSSPHRAKFKRLRVELTKHLVQIEKQMYKQ